MDIQTTEEHQYLSFMLAGDTYALGIHRIKEIIEYQGTQLTGIPLMPNYIAGVINLRGSVVPVVNLNTRFGRKGTSLGNRACIVIVEVEVDGKPHDIGLTVDAVNEVLELQEADIEPVPNFGLSFSHRFVSGMGKVNGAFAIILNPQSILSDEELGALSGAAKLAA